MTQINAGDTRTTIEVYCRHECEACGAPAEMRHSFLLPNPRRNPASSAYGKDDISWCSDGESFTCMTCPEPRLDGMEWSGSQSGERAHHLLHFWRIKSREVEARK